MKIHPYEVRHPKLTAFARRIFGKHAFVSWSYTDDGWKWALKHPFLCEHPLAERPIECYIILVRLNQSLNKFVEYHGKPGA